MSCAQCPCAHCGTGEGTHQPTCARYGIETMPPPTASWSTVYNWHLQRALDANGGNEAKTARSIGCDRRTVYRQIEIMRASKP